MAINISLFQISEAENVFPKTIPLPVSTHTITLKEGCSIDQPTVSFSVGSAIMATLNYAYIDAFGRYYWIRDRNMLVNGVCELTLESDPLQSFAAQIKAVQATITRNENMANGYLQDSGYNALAYEGIQYKHFPNALDDTTCILVTVG
jgi:hypothetical protein